MTVDTGARARSCGSRRAPRCRGCAPTPHATASTPDFQRDTDVHLHVQSAEIPKERASADEDLGDSLRRAVEVDYLTRVDELLELALQRTPAVGSVAAVTPAGRAS